MSPGALLPSAFEAIPALAAGGRPAVFLDYDGTLTPIVARPELAILDPAVRGIVRRLSEYAEVAVVSGRDLEDIRRLVDLDGITVAGSHGFEVRRADGTRVVHAGGEDFLPALASAGDALEQGVRAITGARMERKRFALALHYREVAEEHHAEVIGLAATVARAYPELRVGRGKMVVELRPDAEWHKGRLVAALAGEHRGSGGGAVAYLGDDVTDEDAFVAIEDLEPPGYAIIVGEHASQATAARYALPDVEGTAAWLAALVDALQVGRG